MIKWKADQIKCRLMLSWLFHFENIVSVIQIGNRMGYIRNAHFMQGPHNFAKHDIPKHCDKKIYH